MNACFGILGRLDKFEAEVLQHYGTFEGKVSTKALPERLRIHPFLVPLREKASFVTDLDEALKRLQVIE